MISVPRRTIHLYDGEIVDLFRAALASPDEGRALTSAFEDAFARHLGVRHAIAVGSGRLGLRLILENLGISKGARVLLPAYTDQSVPATLRKVGAEPAYVRVDRHTHNLDPNALKDALGSGAQAIIATHLFGAPCDMARLAKFAQDHGLALIEDCAHAVDARVGGMQCGTLGQAAIFSFVVTKAVNTFGGGLVVTNNDALAQGIRDQALTLPQPDSRALARRIAAGYAINAATQPGVFGMVGMPALRSLTGSGQDAISLYNRLVRPATINANVDTAFAPIQAAVGLQQVRQIPQTQAARHRIAQRLIAACGSTLTPQVVGDGDTHAWYFVVATAEHPEAVVSKLMALGIDVGRYPMRNCAALDDPASGANSFPNAEYLYHHSIQLPVHPTLDEKAVRHIENALRSL